MEIYNYHSETGEFISASKARPNPEEPGQFLIPAHATEIRPPVFREKEAAVFKGSAWQVVPDYRQTTYWLADGTEETIKELNVPLPEGALLEKPVVPKTLDEELKMLEFAVGEYLDTTAQSRGYTDTLYICSYGETGNALFDAEAKAFKRWRNEVWNTFFGQVEEVRAGERPVPEKEALIALLPTISWPSAEA